MPLRDEPADVDARDARTERRRSRASGAGARQTTLVAAAGGRAAVRLVQEVTLAEVSPPPRCAKAPFPESTFGATHRRLVESEKSLTNERVPTSVCRPFCDDNVLVLVALTS